MDRLSFPPITGADDSNNRSAASESHREHTAVNFAEAIEPLFGLAVSVVFGYHALRIRKGVLGAEEGKSVLSLILGGVNESVGNSPFVVSLSNHERRPDLPFDRLRANVGRLPTNTFKCTRFSASLAAPQSKRGFAMGAEQH
jgi:hypothetical protein